MNAVTPIMFMLKGTPELSEAQLKVAQNIIRIQRNNLVNQITSLDQLEAELRKLKTAPVPAARLMRDDEIAPWDVKELAEVPA